MLYLILSIIFILIAVVLFIYIKKYASNYSFIGKLIISLGVILFSLAVVIFPGESFNSALDGLQLWFNIVFPSLLPFFIGSQLLVDLGVVSFIGTLLEPVMRPLFNVPGCGSFSFLMSITSGYPVGSKIVADLYQKKMCSKIEAQRLLSFCSTSGPLFMIGAVGIGMLNMQDGGAVISLSHYLGALCVGFIFRFYKHKQGFGNKTSPSGLKNAYNSFKTTLQKETRPLGLLLSDAVKSSVNNMLTIGGFIVLFSVIINLLSRLGIIDFLSCIISQLITPLGLNKGLSGPVTSGLFEITVGSKLISLTHEPITHKIIAASAIIAWSGLSIIAQVASMISKTDLKLSTYIASKLFHCFFSGGFAFILLRLLNINIAASSTGTIMYNNSYSWIEYFALSAVRFFCLFIILTAVIIIFKLIARLVSSVIR